MHKLTVALVLALVFSSCVNLPPVSASHTEYAAIHRQQTPGNAVQRAAAQPFTGNGARYTELAHGAYGDVPQAGLFNTANTRPGAPRTAPCATCWLRLNAITQIPRALFASGGVRAVAAVKRRPARPRLSPLDIQGFCGARLV